MSREPGHVDVTAVGPATAAAVVWRSNGVLRVTVVTKATFALASGAPMTSIAPEEISRGEAHHRNNPTQSVRITSELAPHMPRTDVILTGHACAPEGTQVAALTVRMSIFGERPVLDRTMYVYGDRKGVEAPAPFDRIPLVYERAFGGLGAEDNPLGVAPDARKAPNLIDPADAQKAVCFGPISRTWPGRRKLLHGADRKALDLPIAEIPADFDFSYYQAAPAEQRADQLRGDEWVYLEGMHATHARLQSRLPSAQARAKVYGLEGADAAPPMSLTLDTVRLDMDELRCSLVWRGSVVIPSEAALDTLSIVTGVEMPGQAIEWPPPPEAQPPARISFPGAPPSSGGSQIPPPPASSPGAPPSARGPAIVVPQPMGSSPGGPRPPLIARPESKFEGTVANTPEEDQRAAQARALPFAGGAPGSAPRTPNPRATMIGVAQPPRPPPPKPTMPAASKFEGTLATTPEEDERAAKGAAVPFGPSGGAIVPPPRPPGAPQAPKPPPFSRPNAAARSTMIGIVQPARPPGPPPGVSKFEGTMAVPIEEEQRAASAPAVPFAQAPVNMVQPTAFGRPPQMPTMGGHSPIIMEAQAPMIAPRMPEAPAAPMIAPAPAVPQRPPRKPGKTANGIRVLHEGPLAFDVIPWGISPSRGCVTLIAKATCDLVPGGPATPRAEAKPLTGDVEIDDDGRKTCVYPDDRAPFKVRADVVLAGHACAPGGSAPSMDVKLRFGALPRGFERTVHVIGERRWEKGAVSQKPSKPQPFSRMPLTWARAYGGPKFEANPAGVGTIEKMKREQSPLPNLEDPDAPLRNAKVAVLPACFAPIPASWKQRWERLGHGREGWSAFGETLDWTIHQAAPRQQQLPFLAGDEPFAIAGASAQHPVIEGALPGIRARCFAVWASDERFEEIPIRLDTVVFATDELELTLVWRAVLLVADERKTGIDTLHLVTEDLKSPGISLDEARGKLLHL